MTTPSASTVVNLVDASNPQRLLQINADGSLNLASGSGSYSKPSRSIVLCVVDATDTTRLLRVNADGSVN